MIVELYGTSGCHLCDQAKDILRLADIAYTPVDVADSDALLEKYGMRIPVLRRADSDAELGWPFDRIAVERFLS